MPRFRVAEDQADAAWQIQGEARVLTARCQPAGTDSQQVAGRRGGRSGSALRPRVLRHLVLVCAAWLIGAAPALSASGFPGSSVDSRELLPASATAAANPVVRHCPAFRPDRRYGDVAERVRADRVGCRQARRLIAAFHNYDRDQGRYAPTRIEGFRCRLGAFAAGAAGRPGTCSAGLRWVRWRFVEYTG